MTISNMLRVTVLSAAALFLFSACDDWTSGTKANSAGGNQVGEFNLTNVYEGQLPDGRAVSRPTRGRISRLNIQQSGRSIIVIDNQGSIYEGFIGNGITQRDNTTPPRRVVAGVEDPNQELAGRESLGRLVTTYPVNFKGFDRVSNLNIEFVGVVEVVTDSQLVGLVEVDGEQRIVEEIVVLYAIRGDWVEIGGRISTVLARTSLETTRIPPPSAILPAPAP